MDMTEKNGQPSMEEILASIRRIIAEEPADAISINLNAKSGAAANDAGLDEHSEFQLPSMFRPGSSTTPEKPAALFGRLTDAIRGAANGTSVEKPGALLQTEIVAASDHDPAQGRTEQPGVTYPALSALRTLRQEPAAPERKVDPARMSSSPVSPANDPATYFATQANADVKREMASFMDTRFSGMAAPSNVQVPIASPPAAPPPAVETTNTVDFTAIIPARMERPFDYGIASPPPLTNTYQNAAPYSTGEPAYRAVQQPEPGPASGGGLEDSTAELLRPMLRQWLAENMPRMVEKALHIEVAESVKPGKKPGMS